MTFAKVSALTAGFVGAIAIGVWISPFITNRAHIAKETVSIQSPAAGTAGTQQATRPARAPKTAAVPSSVKTEMIDVSSPELHKRLRPVLNRGVDISIASSGFRDAEQFATVEHAARNTQVPFMLLKHRVLDERKSLAVAIQELKPELDATAQVRRARAEAREDVSAVAG